MSISMQASCFGEAFYFTFEISNSYCNAKKHLMTMSFYMQLEANENLKSDYVLIWFLRISIQQYHGRSWV